MTSILDIHKLDSMTHTTSDNEPGHFLLASRVAAYPMIYHTHNPLIFYHPPVIIIVTDQT